MVEHEVVIC